MLVFYLTTISNILAFDYFANSKKLHFDKYERFLTSLSIVQPCLKFGYLTPQTSPTKHYPTLISTCWNEKIRVTSIIEDMIYLAEQGLSDKEITLIQQITIVNDTISEDSKDQSSKLHYHFNNLKYTNHDKLPTKTDIHLRFIIGHNGDHVGKIFGGNVDNLLEEVVTVLNLFYMPYIGISKAGGNEKYIYSSAHYPSLTTVQSEFENWEDVDVVVAVTCNTECDYSIKDSICTSRAIAFIDVCYDSATHVAYRLYLLLNNILSSVSNDHLPKRARACLSDKIVKSSVLCGNGVIDKGEDCDCSFSKDLCDLLNPGCNSETCLENKECNKYGKLTGIPESVNTRDQMCKFLLNSRTASEASTTCYVERKAEICMNGNDCVFENLTCKSILCSPERTHCKKYFIFSGINFGDTCKISDCSDCNSNEPINCQDGVCGQNSVRRSNNSMNFAARNISVKFDVVFVSGSLLIGIIIMVPLMWYILRRFRKYRRKLDDMKSIDYWMDNLPTKLNCVNACGEYNNIYSNFSNLT